MRRRHLGLSAFYLGVVTVFVGLGHPARTLVSGTGALLLVGGLVMFLCSLRGETISRPHGPVAVVTLLGLALHVYENAVAVPAGFSLGLVVWGLTPYVVCLAVSAFPAVRTAALVGAAVALSFDLLLHHVMFTGKWDFSKAFLLLERPLVNALVVVPAAILLTHPLLQARRHAPG